MKCPQCTTTDLLMSERSGVEIDYCPKCRGVWLDRGELDKILERAATERPPAPAGPVTGPPYPQPGPVYAPPPHHDSDDSKFGYTYHDPKKRRKHWLSELFD